MISGPSRRRTRHPAVRYNWRGGARLSIPDPGMLWGGWGTITHLYINFRYFFHIPLGFLLGLCGHFSQGFNNRIGVDKLCWNGYRCRRTRLTLSVSVAWDNVVVFGRFLDFLRYIGWWCGVRLGHRNVGLWGGDLAFNDGRGWR
jgi:hypothetical protein